MKQAQRRPRGFVVMVIAVVIGLLLGRQPGAQGSQTIIDFVTIESGDTPFLRLFQDNTGGFLPLTWDITGNDIGFFIGRPGAPSSSLTIQKSGRIGLGTDTPAQKLHVFESVDANTFIQIENPMNGFGSAAVLRAKSDTATVNFQAHASGRFLSRFGQTLGGFAEFLQVTGNGLIIGTLGGTPLILGSNNADRLHIASDGNIGLGGNTAPDSPIHALSGARLTAGGVWQDASSRALKQDIRDLTAEDARAALDRLSPVRFAYTADPAEQHVGFIAEEVPDLVATKDRTTLSAMDIVAVLTRVVREQQKAIAELTAEVAVLRRAAEPAK